jgi:hypothetical protein
MRAVQVLKDPAKTKLVIEGLTKKKVRESVVKAGSVKQLVSRFKMTEEAAKKLLGL